LTNIHAQADAQSLVIPIFTLMLKELDFHRTENNVLPIKDAMSRDSNCSSPALTQHCLNRYKFDVTEIDSMTSSDALYARPHNLISPGCSGKR
jgi:hypothetical protein